MIVSDAIRRTAETDADGRFTFDPLPPGEYRVKPSETNFDGDRKIHWTRRPLPEVFAPTKLTIKEGETPAPLEIRASPSVVIEGHWVDSKGQPKGGWSSFVFGQIDGSFWNAQAHPDRPGQVLREGPARPGGGPARHHDQRARLDAAPDRQGRAAGRGPQASSSARSTTTSRISRSSGTSRRSSSSTPRRRTASRSRISRRPSSTPQPGPNNATRTSTSWAAGRRRTPSRTSSTTDATGHRSMLPDKEVNVIVSADGFAAASRKLSLPEGKTEEVTFVLEPKCTQGSGPMRARRRGSGRAPGDAGGPAVVGRWSRAGAAAGRVGAAGRRVRPARRQPVRPARLQRRELPRVVPGAGRAEPEPLRPRPRPRLPGDRARGQRPPRERPRSRPQPGPAEGHRPGAARGGPAVRPRVVGVPRHPRLDRRRRPARPGPARGPGDRDPASPSRGSNVRAQPAGSRSSPASPTAPRPTSPRSATSVSGTPRSPTSRPRGSSGASGPATPRWSPPTTAWSRRPASSSRPVGPCRSPMSPTADIVDREVYAKLRALGIEPSGPAADAEFLRRVTLDVIGTLPTPGRGPRLPRRSDRPTSVRGRSTACSRTRCTPRSGPPATSTSPVATSTPWKDPTSSARAGPGSGTTGSGRGSPRTRPTTRSPAACSARPAATATTPAPGPVARPSRLRSLRDGGETDYADKPGLDLFWRRLVNGEVLPGRAAGRAGRHDVPGRPHRMRPVPQAPVRPLDPGRLPRVRQHRRGRPVRPLPRRPRRDRRPPRRAAQGRPDGRPAPDPPHPRGLRLGPVLPAARRPRHRPPARPARPGRARAARRRRPARAALRLARDSPTTPTSPAASSTASGPSTSARASWTRSTASRSPTRPRTRGCSTPWRPTSSPTATTSAGSNGRC